jgi:pimeloyl-ACP methyl ester carboxylesterase
MNPQTNTWALRPQKETIVGDVSFEVLEVGEGAPLVFLHGEDGLRWSEPLIQELAANFRVHAPHHPGWGGSTRPRYMGDARSIALAYVEYLEEQVDGPAIVVGCSFGGWVAAELATFSRAPIAGLVLASPTGVKLGERDERDYVDIFMQGFDALPGVLYGDPSHAPDLTDLSDEDYVYLAVAQEATARYAWRPYMHDQTLRHWLRRISAPTLVVAGTDDRFTLISDFYDRYAELIGPAGATLRRIEGAGHRVEEEAPAELARLIKEFIDSPATDLAGAAHTAGS